MQVKKKFENHRGSALLIVLGMLAFMVVSAVGFSIYMRQGRMPSSYLRRNISSRYLVKAALANAIEELDGGFMSRYEIGENDTDNPEQGRFFGIHDDPYPGVGDDMDKSGMNSGSRKFTGSTYQHTYNVQYCANGDFWFHRVFCPFGPLPHPNSMNDSLDEPPLTTPTLTLEALAYLPPAIMDDVRKASRVTRTAQWRSLPYEAGRFAYTAVNVSDLFDVNRLHADVARNSAADRITLTSLCAKAIDTPVDVDDTRVDDIETILEQLESLKIGSEVTPFTSLADFNLVAKGASKLDYAPFMDYIGKSSANLLRNDLTSPAANALFVTDTWFPPTNSSGQVVYDLADGYQPFDDTWDAKGFLQASLKLNPKNGSGNQNLYLKNLGIGLVSLYDYLDSDSIPLSLALPTVEAVPMVVGVNAPINLKPQIAPGGAPITQPVAGLSGTYNDSDGNQQGTSAITITRTLTQMNVNFNGGAVQLPVVVTYPFKRMKTTQRAKTYNVRAMMRVWVAPSGMNFRPFDPNVILHPQQADWSQTSPFARDGVATFMSDTKPLSSFNKDIETTADAVDTVTLTFQNMNLEMPLYWQVKEESPTLNPAVPGATSITPDPANFKAEYKSLAGLSTLPAALRPLTAEGRVADAWKAEAERPFTVAGKYPTGVGEFDPAATLNGNYRVYSAVWVQVLDGSQVVDMAPASRVDDIYHLGASDGDTGAGVGDAICGDGAPLLNFMNTLDFTYANPEQAFPSGSEVAFTWKSLFAVDPRFNHAPEDWFATAAIASPTEWMNQLGLNGSTSQIFGQDGRDRDIFMFVSDQEYLQSIGELQFLLSLHELDGSGSFPDGDLPAITASVLNANPQTFGNRMGGYAALKDKDVASGGFAHQDFFWRTYTAYRNHQNYTTEWVNPYRMKTVGGSSFVEVVSGVGGFKLNPFSQDDRVMNAAVIGTPFDYYVSSTNDNQKQTGGHKNQIVGNLSYDDMMSKYSFGKPSVAQMSEKELTDIVDELRGAFAGMRTFNMDSSWGSLLWQHNDVANSDQINDNNTKFLADDLVLSKPLHAVDRKFLYSFWRDCFDNRQQLFLIFVRAEPTAVGGGAAGAITSAQLGGRAVALVWRDPAIPTQGIRIKRTDINNRTDFRNFKRENAPHRTRVLFYHQFD